MADLPALDLSAIDDALIGLAATPWLPVALYLLVVGDAFLVILPSETVVVALGALGAATGSPAWWVVVPVAAVGALTGDLLCFALGRVVGIDRWSWMREGRVARALARVRHVVTSRPAALIFTARYIPFARIAVNLSAGASGLPMRRFLPLAAAAGLGWAVFNVGIGAGFGALLGDQPLLAVGVSIVAAVVLGLTIDAVVGRRSRRRAAAEVSDGPAPTAPRIPRPD